MDSTVQIEHGCLWILAEFTRANLVPEAVHRHFCGEISGLRREVVNLRNDRITAPEFLENSLPAFYQSVEWLGVVFGVIDDDPFSVFDPHLVLRVWQIFGG